MAFHLTPEQVAPAWRTMTTEVIFAPKTGSLRPWELYGCFTFPVARKVFWGSFKTEQTARKSAAKQEAAAKKYAEQYG